MEGKMDIEKNDVSLADLFRWNSEVEIKDHKGRPVAKVYMRVVGDKDLGKARVFALRKSSELRKALKTEGSDEYEAYIGALDTDDRERLEIGAKILQTSDIASIARRNAVVKYPPEPPSDATLEEQEAYQKAVDEFPDKYTELVQKEMEKLLKKEEKRIAKLSIEELIDEYKNGTINYVCQQEMSRSFTDMCIFLGTYKDSEYSKKYFGSYDEYDNLATEVKDQLIDAYSLLETGMDTVKKLQEATQ